MIRKWLGLCPHKWGPWEQYKEHVNLFMRDGTRTQDVETRQHRHCTLCNKEQDQIVKGTGK